MAGLLALMLLTDARRPARTRADGELVPLAEQDRTRGDGALITEGVAYQAQVESGSARYIVIVPTIAPHASVKSSMETRAPSSAAFLSS